MSVTVIGRRLTLSAESCLFPDARLIFMRVPSLAANRSRRHDSADGLGPSEEDLFCKRGGARCVVALVVCTQSGFQGVQHALAVIQTRVAHCDVGRE